MFGAVEVLAILAAIGVLVAVIHAFTPHPKPKASAREESHRDGH
jgi:hypothetical protein